MDVMGVDHCAFVDYTDSNDFYLYEVGDYKCVPGYGYGPIMRSQTIFHYVISGKGKLVLEGKEFEIHANQGFLIPVNMMAYYEADKDDPWTYVWIHVDGPKAVELFKKAGLTKNHPVFIPTADCSNIYDIIMSIYERSDEEYFCMGKVYEFFNTVVRYSSREKSQEVDSQLMYVTKVIRYIQVNYSGALSVDEIAKLLGLNRSYLTRLFKKSTGQSPQEYIFSYRMKQAASLLLESDQSVQYVAFSVGYSDSFTFSKAFKRYYGVSPRDYRLEQSH